MGFDIDAATGWMLTATILLSSQTLSSLFLSKFVDSSERFDAGVVLSSLPTPLLARLDNVERIRLA